MPGFANVLSFVGNTPPDNLFTPTTEQKIQQGMLMLAVDPYFGYGEFIYGKAAAAQITGECVYQSNEGFTFAATPSTAMLGFPLLFARQEMAANSWGWYQKAGMSPAAASVSVAVGAQVGLGTAGKVGTNTAGKQVVGASVRGASAFALTKSGATTLALGRKKLITVSNTDGLFVGMAISGTGIPASTVITSIDPGGNSFLVNNDATAAGSGTITGTYTGYVLLVYNNPFSQGAIT